MEATSSISSNWGISTQRRKYPMNIGTLILIATTTKHDTHDASLPLLFRGGEVKFLETTQVHFVRPHTACVHYKYFAANMYTCTLYKHCVRPLRHTLRQQVSLCTSFRFAKDKVLFLKKCTKLLKRKANLLNFLGEHVHEPPLKATCMFYSHLVAPGN